MIDFFVNLIMDMFEDLSYVIFEVTRGIDNDIFNIK